MPRLLFALPALVFALTAAAVPPDAEKKKAPEKGSPAESLAQVRVEKGLTVEVWAAEPLMRNPVAFAFDETGRAFVVETNRLHTGVPDTRNFMKWLDEDLANRTTADRLAMYQKHNYTGFEKHDDQLRLVWDSTGGGKADKSTVFSKGYNRPEDGLAAGVLARKGNVYFADIPDLYLLKDTDGDGTADEKKSLFTGFGPTAQFIGHDLHGLRMGPDGKLYFSIGDRGFNVKTKEGKQLLYPNMGAVLRCDPDGGNLEVVHYGLRNPQELAFDDYGNLFVYDNNSDSGDRARWVYIVEGGDSGWRGGYQYGTLYHPPGVPQGNRGPWNAEKIWHVPGKDGEPPAYVVPPLLHLGNGPSGITHYPGIGLNDKYRDHFFACDFTSSPGNSVIWSLAVKPKGASFEVVKPEPFVKGIVPTDCDFGPDGAFYWSDWVAGWGHPNKGRIFRLTDPEAMKNPAVAGAKKLLAEGLENKSSQELQALLEHPHQQVRLEAQYRMAERNLDQGFARVLEESKNRLARLHAVWGLGMHERATKKDDAVGLIDVLKDPDAEIRAQSLKTLADLPLADLPRLSQHLRPHLAKLLADPEPRVRFFAALAVGRVALQDPNQDGPAQNYLDPYPLLFGLLKANNDADAYLRHAAVVALAALERAPRSLQGAWARLKKEYDTPAVRMGVLLAYRRTRTTYPDEFLTDRNPRIAVEAARAMYDAPVPDSSMSNLIHWTTQTRQPDPIAYRALAACYRHGSKMAAEYVARFAARKGEPDHQRVFALKLLADWSNPPRRDPITGLTLDLPKRDAAIAANALKPVIGGAFSGSDAVRGEAAKVSAALGIKEVGPLLTKIVKDTTAPASSRADALTALAAVKDPGLADATAFALASDQPKLRAAGLTLQAQADPAAVLKKLPALLASDTASVAEKQAAFAILGGFPESAAADKLLDEWLSNAFTGDIRGELLLDVVEAAERRTKAPRLKLHAPLKQDLDTYEKAKTLAGDKVAAWKEALAGGDAEKGRAVFLNNSAVSCQRCHKLDGQGGDVGPALNGLAAQPGKDRRYLLESITLPSAQIAKGYETAVLTLLDGRVVSGVVKEETKARIKLVTAENKELVIPADDIESRRTGPSAMPEDLHKKLSRRELRDVVEFLAGLTEPEPKGGK